MSKQEDYFYRDVKEKFSKRDYQGAIEDCSKAIELDPENLKALINRGHAKIKLKDYLGAIKDYSKAIKLNPADKFRREILNSRSEAFKKLSEIDLKNI